jgi:hypothetical protein
LLDVHRAGTGHTPRLSSNNVNLIETASIAQFKTGQTPSRLQAREEGGSGEMKRERVRKSVRERERER